MRRWSSSSRSPRMRGAQRAEPTSEWLATHAPLPVLRRAARASARTKALAPRPGWHFDVDYLNTDPGTTFRRAIWERFSEAGDGRGVVIPWYDGLRVRLFLGNDLSKCLINLGSVRLMSLAFSGP